MNIMKKWRPVALAACVPVLLLAEVAPDTPLRISLGRDASAVVGAPATPVSVAGAARRTTRRVVATEAAVATTAVAASSAAAASTAQQQQAVAAQQSATAQQQAAVAQQQAAVAQQQAQAAGAPAIGTIVPALPAGCVAENKSGVQYKRCGNVYYRAGFQSNNVVYAVVPQP